MLTRNPRLKRTLWGIFLGFFLVLFPLISHALTVQEVPNPQQQYGGWVTDMANILSDETENQLNRMIAELEATTGAELAVVTVPTTAPSPSPKAFTTELFNHWGIGKAGGDNGVLFLTAVEERRVEVETGYGVEGVLSDAKVGTIMRTQVTPRFQEENFEAGILAGTQGLIEAIAADPPPAPIRPTPSRIRPTPPTTTPRDWTPFLLVGGGALATIAGGTAYQKSRRIFIEPTGRSRSKKLFHNPRRLYCEQCQHSLTLLEDSELDSHLTPPERVAQQLGSVQFKGVFCATCFPSHPIGGVQILSYETQLSNVTDCPTCQELTVTRTVINIVEQPTWNQTGKQRIAEDCHCCDRHEEILEDIPRLEPPSNAVFLEPTGRSRIQDHYSFNRTREGDRPAHCKVCRYPLEKIQGSPLQSFLTKPETTAQTLGSVKFIGWECTHCYPESGSHHPFHIRGYIQQKSAILECADCQELTVTRTTQVIQQPTTYSSGTEEIRDRCHCCGNENTQSIILPALPPPPPVYPSSSQFSSSSSSTSADNSSTSGWQPSSSSYSSSDSSSSYSSSDSSSYSSSDSSSYSSDSSSYSSDSSDFGGGSSGGGGAGEDW